MFPTKSSLQKLLMLAMWLMLLPVAALAQQSFEPPKLEKNTAKKSTFTKRATITKKLVSKQTIASHSMATNTRQAIPPTIKRSVDYAYYKADDGTSEAKKLQELNDYQLEIQAVRGNIDAQYLIGERWVFSDSETDMAKGMGWLEKAANAEDSNAQALLGYCFYCMDEAQLAGKWYQAAARQGNAVGQYLLGCALANGECGLEQNMTEAATWFALSARQGLPDAQYAVGLHLYYGLGVEKNIDWARKWMKLAANNGYDDARKFIDSHKF
jgi:TPR repeat protein